MFKFIAISAALSVALTGAQAATVSLKSADGEITVDGDIVGSDGTIATIKSQFGTIEVPIAKMNCFSGDCHTGINWANSPKQIAFAVSDARGRAIVDLLSDSLNENEDYEVQLARGEDGLNISQLSTGSTVSVQLMDDRDAAQTYFDVAAPEATVDEPWSFKATPAAQLIGVGALSVVAHPALQLDGLSLEQLAGIYAGDIVNWSELGGPDQRIVALKRDPGSMDLTAFEKLVMAPFDKQVAANVLAVDADQKIADHVVGIPGSIGVVDARVARDGNTIPMVSQCGAHLTATGFEVASGDYPLVRPLYVVHQEKANDLTIALFDSVAQGESQTSLAALGLTDGGIVPLSNDAKSTRMKTIMNASLAEDQRNAAKALVELMFVSNRLSATFFAGDISAGQAAWNRAHMLRLSAMLEAGEYDDHELVFAGFARNGGDVEASQDAATQALDAFGALLEQTGKTDQIKLLAQGYGAVGHSDCAQANAPAGSDYRIEVWVRKASGSG